MTLWATWWVWLAGALILAIVEVLVPAFIALGFAIGGVVVGVLIYFGLMPDSLPWTLVVFGCVSIVAWLGLRQAIGVRRGQVRRVDYDINEIKD